jgi:hypothetical protein
VLLSTECRLTLEFLVSSLYYNAEYAHALQLVLDALDESKKPMGGLSRELIDTGIRSALRAGDTQNAVALACMTQDQASAASSTPLTTVEEPIRRACDRIRGRFCCGEALAR